ncbi:glycoside hydrolase family 32 protein [Caldifermentibacillus hisashii]|uniref:glycoside hydrolase family 32 protein n=1 Tax=Caldifermentibacillus hisashii TaxID=996558 RepID=UPI000BA47816|nr:glycoside hydrolase family 32 protein [Caldifermentibacillus hisashii]PAC35339.1 glycoside hydrolase [Caldifermentibacillus hisashii]
MKTTKLEKYRPVLHFSPNRNWMNDPNGLVFFKGEYHLFFQHNPFDNIHGPMYWGHAVSKDLVEWEELDIALFPDELGTIFSGSAVVDWHNTSGFFPDEPGLVAIFTHHLEGTENNPTKQSQSLAYSRDRGRTWVKYEGNPVLTHPTKVDFRDPKVFWHEASNKWMMVLATGQTVSFYSSPNLKEWKFESEFGDGIGSHDGVWECPDLFELSIDNSGIKKWVLLVSIGDNPRFDSGSRTQYFVGSFDGNQFVAENNDIKWLDFGKDNYAGVSFSDIPQADGRRIYIGWMSNWRYANHVPTEGWRSQMTLPRELMLRKVDGDTIVVQKVVGELNSYFSKQEELNGVTISGEMDNSYEVDADYAEVELTLENVNASQYGLTIWHTKTQFTTITIDTNENRLSLDRKNSGKVDFSDNFPKTQTVNLKGTIRIQLRIIIDTSSLELFINDGEQALTSLVYPDKACEGISLFAVKGNVNLVHGKISVPSN